MTVQAVTPTDRDPGVTTLAAVATELDRAARAVGVTIGSANIRIGRWPSVEIHCGGPDRITNTQGAAFLHALGVDEVTSKDIHMPGMLGGPMVALSGHWDGIGFTVYADPARLSVVAS